MPDVICCAMEICCGKKADETEDQWQARRADLITTLVEAHAGNIHDAIVYLLSVATLAPKEFTPAIRATAKAAREHKRVSAQSLLKQYKSAVQAVIDLAREHPEYNG